MKGAFLLLLFLFQLMLFSQGNPRLKNSFNEKSELNYYFGKISNHTAVKKSFSGSIADINDTSSFWNNNLIDFSKKYLSTNKSRRLIINPAFDFSLGYQNLDENVVSKMGLGFDLFASRGENKWTMGFTMLKVNSNYMKYQNDFISENKVVPGMGVSNGIDRVNSNYYSGFLNYQAGKYFNFEVGYGRQFIGDGYRSLLLSDNSNASPYLKVTTKFWKIKYTNIYASHQNIYNVEGKSSLYQRKYTATHFLDWEITKWLNLGLFETIVWQADEGKYRRGVDPNYLNPVIFYRPVEFSIGSSDNALVGANLKFSLPKRNLIYFQTILDEFLLSELKADFNQFRNPDDDIRSGWWANKYGVQVGWKKFEWFGLEGLNTRVEYNFVRPFTYAHTNSNQSYANYNISLAHPLGANFEEFLAIINYQKQKFYFKAHLNYSVKGVSLMGLNFGDNIQESNVTRTLEYENELKQGIKHEVFYVDASFSYLLQERWKASVSLGFIYRNESANSFSESNNMIYISFKTNLYNSYFNY
jgi:hypothetical protein